MEKRESVIGEGEKSFSKCRFCGADLHHTFVDLGMSPLCETFLQKTQLNNMEAFYPLHVYVCDQCYLVQLDEYVTPADIFSHYAYFSSYSDSWVAHAKKYVDQVTKRFNLTSDHKAMEIASNDGYLLQHFISYGIPVLGIEPAENVAQVSIDKGIPNVVKFFGVETAKEIVAEHGKADLLLGNNVLAHVPDLNDFVGGMKILLNQGGVITMEFPHLLRLMQFNQFDTIYHEHFSYLSILAVEKIFSAHGLTLFDVEELKSHGGSLRIYAQHQSEGRPDSDRLIALRRLELKEGMGRLETYFSFDNQVKLTKRNLLSFLIEAKDSGKSIAGYGAPGKGNTLLNYCGIRQDFIDYTVDRNPFKHGKYTPGTHIPIYAPEKIKETKPDYVFILPWNLKEEIMEQMAYIREWGGRFVVPIPKVQVIP